MTATRKPASVIEADVFADARDAREECRLALVQERVRVDRLEPLDEVVEVGQAGRRRVGARPTGDGDGVSSMSPGGGADRGRGRRGRCPTGLTVGAAPQRGDQPPDQDGDCDLGSSATHGPSACVARQDTTSS